jgi:hypothetical protein
MLAVTRTWNAVCAVSAMRRGLALAGDYATRRLAFGALLADKPLHADTLAVLEAEYAAAFCLAFRAVELLGALEHGPAGQPELQDRHELLSRVVTPIAKLVTAKQAVAVTSEAIEACGGAGYVEDTGLPRVLADAQVLPIWEGTTNVLSLEALRALEAAGGLAVVKREAGYILQGVREPDLVKISARVEKVLEQADTWLTHAVKAGTAQVEAGARRFAMTLGRALSLALIAKHAQWSIRHEQDRRTLAAARRYAAQGVNLLAAVDAEDSRLLARDG